jgi:cyclase
LRICSPLATAPLPHGVTAQSRTDGQHTYLFLQNYCGSQGADILLRETMHDLLRAGADKISINSAAVANPDIINQIAAKYGSQFLVLAIDAKQVDGIWRITTHGGNKLTDKELISWAYEGQERGAGEILFTSMDHDGTKNGYPCETYAALSDKLSIPIIASGGAGSVDDIVKVLTEGKADAALAASIFHYGEVSIGDLKKELQKQNIKVRL